jgi:hypothetical protein
VQIAEALDGGRDHAVAICLNRDIDAREQRPPSRSINSSILGSTVS